MRLSVYMQVQQGIVNMIASQKLKVGTMLPPERKLARLFDCNVITLRKALDNLQKSGVIRKKARLGSFVNVEIKNNISSGTIGYLCIQKSSQDLPIIYDSTDVINSKLIERGYKLKVLTAGNTPSKELIDHLQELTGVIVSGWINEQWASLLRGLSLPIVVVGLTPFENINIPYAIYDYRKMTIRLGQYWLKQGAKKIGLITSGGNYGASFAMREGFRYLLKSNGIEYNSSLVLFSEDEKYGHDVWNFLDANKNIDALLVESGFYQTVLGYLLNHPIRPGIGVMREQEYKGVVPKNVVFACFNDNAFEKGVELLFKVIESGNKKVENIKIKPHLIQ